MASEQRIIQLNPRDLQSSRRNVRSDPGDLAGLAETIREHGILQPLGVVPEGDGYRVVYGHRRRDAAIVVGLERVPCLVLDGLDEEEVVVRQVLENLQRLDLNDIDKAQAFEQMLTRLAERGATQSEGLDAMARSLGLSTRQIQRYLRLRGLCPAVQALIAAGELGVTHGQHLADIGPETRQEEIARLAVEENLSVAELSRLCAALQHNGNIEPLLALEMLRRGERIAAVDTRPRENLPHMGPEPTNPLETIPWDGPADKPEAEEGDPGEDDAGTPRDPRRALPGNGGGAWDEARGYGSLEPATRDGNRVRKIHSLDSFMDEVQRLAVCLQEGDLQRLLEADEAGAMKLRLAARQLRFLADTVATLAGAAEAAS
jgi:ParB family chromosome partitioning protein